MSWHWHEDDLAQTWGGLALEKWETFGQNDNQELGFGKARDLPQWHTLGNLALCMGRDLVVRCATQGSVADACGHVPRVVRILQRCDLLRVVHNYCVEGCTSLYAESLMPWHRDMTCDMTWHELVAWRWEWLEAKDLVPARLEAENSFTWSWLGILARGLVHARVGTGTWRELSMHGEWVTWCLDFEYKASCMEIVIRSGFA